MRSRIPLSLSLLCLSLAGARAQTADDFFHGGAQSYLSNNIPGAMAVVTNGLQRFPKDQKLQKLYELLNQQQQQQQNQQDKKDQNQKDEQKQDQKKQDEQKQQDQSKNDQQKKGEQKQQEKQKSGGDKSKEQSEQKKETGEPQQATAHAMTPEEAKQLLDAQKGDEQVLQFRPQAEPKNREKKLKDW